MFSRSSRLIAATLLAGTAQAQQPAASQTLPVDGVVAVVGSQPILWSEVMEQVTKERARGAPIPNDSAGALEYARNVIIQMIDEEVLLQRATGDTSITVTDEDLTETVDQQVQQVRGQFPSEQEFLRQLRLAGFGTQDEYRRFVAEQARRTELQRRLVQKYQSEGKMIKVAISDVDVNEAYERAKATFPKRPPAVTFRQVIVATSASPPALEAARVKAESLLTEIRRGADFEQVARRESQDSVSREQGGDLGWNRRGELVPAFEETMFRLAPGRVSSLVLTQYGYHIIKVERAKPSEVKARHILIKPVYSPQDTVVARARADSVLQRWRAGVPFDTLVKRYHDADEAEGSLEPFPKEQLPPSYRDAIGDLSRGAFVGPFPIADRGRGMPKYVVLQLTDVIDAGDYTVEEVRERMRQQISQERSFRRLLDQLKAETYVRVFPIEQFMARP
ncbi:MAG TPA: peptidylprolyl isomerase [Gemmatimonadaceae bacterium]